MTDPQAGRRTPWVAASIAAPLVVLTVLVVAGLEALRTVDAAAVDGATSAVEGTGWDAFFDAVTVVGSPRWVSVVLLLMALWFVVRRQMRTAVWVAAVVVVNAAAWGVLKQLVTRSRPATVPPDVANWSFPSGHACTVAAGMGVLAILTLRRVRRPQLRVLLVSMWVVVVVIVGASRVFTGEHYPSDVIAGWLLGALAVVMTSALFGVTGTSRPVPVPHPVQATPGPLKTFAVVLNPTKIDPTIFKTKINAVAKTAGYDEPLWFETTVDDAGASMARAAVAAGADMVVAAGGDGTVRVVCSEMAGSGVPVGLVPAGTGNLLARNLGVPLLLDLALETVFFGRDRAIDIVSFDGDGLAPTRFVVMAGLGLDAAIMAGAPDALKARIGWPAYVVAGARQLRYPAVRVDISVDGAEPVSRLARTVVIGNVGSLQAGIPLLPDALIDDGVLDVVVIAPRRLYGWLPLLLRVMTRRRRTDERLDRFTGTSVTITAAHSTPRELDGDIVSPGTEIRAEIEPGQLIVRVPPEL